MTGQDATWPGGHRVSGPSGYQVVDGRVHTDGIEVVIAQHCNLRCRACAYLSPVLPKMLADPGRLLRDLARLAEVYHASEARVLGGEPLLHPEITAVLAAIRSSGICGSIRVITNGLLLPRAPAGFWRLVDEVSVSVYPGREPSPEATAAIVRTAATHQVAVKFKHFDLFRESYTEAPAADRGLVERIYRTCQMAHVWRCHTVWEGRLYRCPQSLFLPAGLPARADLDGEGIEIGDHDGFLGELLAFLDSPWPLPSCRNCLGSVGRVFVNEQVPRSSWRAPQRRPVEELIDWRHLEMLEANPGTLVPDASYLDPAAVELA